MDGSSRVSTYHATMAAKPELMSHWYCSIVPTPLCVGVFGREKGGRCRPPSNRAHYPCVECLAWHRARGALAPPTRRRGYILRLELDEMAELQPPYPPMSLRPSLTQKMAIS